MVQPKPTDDLPKVIHITPKIEDLLPNKVLICPEINCCSTFSNISNLQMHLTRHHRKKMPPQNQNSTDDNSDSDLQKPVVKLYFCPISSCDYHISSKCRKNFAHLRYLRQHYQKVHAEKSFGCSKCVKMFSTESIKAAHEINCGQTFECNDCGWSYTSKEALLTHARRKNHKITSKDNFGVENAKKQIMRVKVPVEVKVKPVNISLIPLGIVIKSKMENKAIQTDSINSLHPLQVHNSKKAKSSSKRNRQSSPDKNARELKKAKLKNAQIQTNKDNHQSPLNDTPSNVIPKTKDDFFNLNLYDTESRPNHNKDNINHLSYVDDTVSNCFDLVSSGFCNIETQTEFSASFLDQMLCSNMHTQTCDEFLSELALTNIETQTNWSEIASPAGTDGYHQNQKHNLTQSGPLDELLVSTETQTSFTQCLLECGKGSVNGITQHTQTCDTLLEGLFGGQENDLIASFQSTHTQT